MPKKEGGRFGRMRNLMGGLKVKIPGALNRYFNYDELNEQFKQQFWHPL